MTVAAHLSKRNLPQTLSPRPPVFCLVLCCSSSYLAWQVLEHPWVKEGTPEAMHGLNDRLLQELAPTCLQSVDEIERLVTLATQQGQHSWSAQLPPPA